MFKKVLSFGASLALLLVALTACGDTSQAGERGIVQRQQTQYGNVQPAPYFNKSLERQEMIQLYRARNQAASTFSYVQNQYTGKIMFECASIGYPLPYSVQITAPENYAYSSGGSLIASLPQAEPNGLYSPPTASGTWLMCLNDDGTVAPSYHEPLVSSFPYPMKEVDGKLVRADNSTSISIDIAEFAKGAGKDLNANGAISTQVAQGNATGSAPGQPKPSPKS